MANESNSGPLMDAAKAIGSTLGKVVSTVTGGGSGDAKDGVWAAQAIGSGTFLISKPKRKSNKRRQTALHSRRPGMRK